MNFKNLFDKIKSSSPKIIGVSGAENDHIIEACSRAKKDNLAHFILIGDSDKIAKVCATAGFSVKDFEIIDVKDDKAKAQKACSLYAENKISIVMKGTVATGTLLKEVLDEKYGLKGNGFLSHIACIETKDRFIGITDGGLNIAPSLEEKIKITQNAISFFSSIGVNLPKVALVSAFEIPSAKMQSTIDAAIIAKMAQRGDIKGGLVDGPFGLDNAISKEAAQIKGIDSPVAGVADILVAPSIEAANMCAKGIIYFAETKNGGVIIGASTPIILLSRADDSETKYNSILLALAMNQN